MEMVSWEFGTWGQWVVDGGEWSNQELVRGMNKDQPEFDVDDRCRDPTGVGPALAIWFEEVYVALPKEWITTDFYEDNFRKPLHNRNF